jgi:hypothetical protein
MTVSRRALLGASGFGVSIAFGPVAFAARPDDVHLCIACAKPMIDGQKYLPDESGGVVHYDCLGPERECYTRNGEPLKDGDPIPEGYIWSDD